MKVFGVSESDSNRLTGRDWLWLSLICSFGLGSVVIQAALDFGAVRRLPFLAERSGRYRAQSSSDVVLAGLPGNTGVTVHF